MSLPQSHSQDSLSTSPQVRVEGPLSEQDNPDQRNSEQAGPLEPAARQVIDIDLVVHFEENYKAPQNEYRLTRDDNSLESLVDGLRRLSGTPGPVREPRIALLHAQGDLDRGSAFDSLDELHAALTIALDQMQAGDRIQCHAKFSVASLAGSSKLSNEFLRNQSRSVFGGAVFISTLDFDRIMDPQKIKEFCATDNDLKDDSNMTDEIIEHGRKLLATFLLAGFNSPGAKFKEAWNKGKRDKDMPFDLRKAGFLWLEDSEKQTLQMMQWQTQAVIFPKPSKEIAVGEYGVNAPIPITEKKKIADGSFGSVYRIKIADGHHSLYSLRNDPNPYMALKEYRRPTRTADFKREFDLLLEIAQKNHPHLIRLLFAFKWGEDCYLILPLASRSLKRRFESKPQSFKRTDSKFRTYVVWILRQFRGLADALNALHNIGITALDTGTLETRVGYHHDFKPANILHFESLEETGISGSGLSDWEKGYGRLQLTDLGLGKIRERDQGTHTRDTRTTPTYAAPETEQGGLQGRQADIWAFACVVLEAMVWLMEGPGAIKKFSSARISETGRQPQNVQTDAYFKKVSDNKFEVCGIVKLKVETVRHGAFGNDRDSPINKLMDLVENCWKIERTERPLARDVVKALDEIVVKAQRVPEDQSFFKSDEEIKDLLKEEQKDPRSIPYTHTWPVDKFRSRSRPRSNGSPHAGA